MIQPRSSDALCLPLHFERFAVSWAGAGRDNTEFCFGSEDGRLAFTAIDGVLTGQTEAGDLDSEAVNGIAFGADLIAVSSRRSVTFWAPRDTDSTQCSPCTFRCGSHGIMATRTGRFVAPLGPTGLMIARATPEHQISIDRVYAPDRALDCYKAIVIDSGSQEMLACAARFAGVAVIDLSHASESGKIRSITSVGLDVVDVCRLSAPNEALALAALDRRGTLVLFRNAVDDRSSVAVKFHDVQGTGYRVFSARGHVLALTSEGLYVLKDLAQRFMEGEPVARTPTSATFGALEAVDANLVHDRWLLIVMNDRVLRIDMDLLLASSPEAGLLGIEQKRSFNATIVSTVWESRLDMAHQTAMS